ncbi:50S ribosomal protein L1 [Thiomicrorhabdus lithotrophica]|uniref:Large ribosomal subunit protein uL1 n=1 Tax=Thiomicrorhabdus lithotrophica TaxID=2949997 RepID=A0ABY8CAJ1_9GAMM|nr:50S ribosomal protein L1 [Thiomicrorhabdus lithotrophica]WEJ62996.1 50S ribosomal protein L1 [Thiomicrorhabdus lithotrophica]
MAKLTKRQKAWAERVSAETSYDIIEGLNIVKDLATSKFSESVDVAIRLGIDPKKSDQVVRGASTMPNGTGKDVRVAVFTGEANQAAAKEAGAEFVGMDELAAEIKGGMMDFDVVIASPDAMRVVGMLGQVLGPRGLMPNPKTGTVTPDVVGAIQKAKAGQVRFRADKAGIIHASVGTVAFDADKLKENINALMEDLVKAKPASAKGTYVKKVTISSTMGPGLVVDQSSL